MKPLELTWYERDEDGDYAHPTGYFITEMDVDDWNEWKHLADSELAAEYWCEEKGLGDVRYIAETRPGYLQIEPVMLARVLTLHRFAALPHASESDYR